MCHLLFYSLSIYIKWSLLRISKKVLFSCFFFLFDLFSVHWLPTQTLSFPRWRTSVRIDVCSLNLLCSNKDVLYRLCFRRRQNSVTLENLWRCFVCARLYCRICTLSLFFFSSSKCAVLGDSVEVLEKCWGLFPPPSSRGYSGSLW